MFLRFYVLVTVFNNKPLHLIKDIIAGYYDFLYKWDILFCGLCSKPRFFWWKQEKLGVLYSLSSVHSYQEKTGIEVAQDWHWNVL